jgi:hypothetical protein
MKMSQIQTSSVEIEVPIKFELKCLEWIVKNWDEKTDFHINDEGYSNQFPIGHSYLEDDRSVQFSHINFHSSNPSKWVALVTKGKFGMVRNRYGGGHRYRQTTFSWKAIIKAEISIDEGDFQ